MEASLSSSQLQEAWPHGLSSNDQLNMQSSPESHSIDSFSNSSPAASWSCSSPNLLDIQPVLHKIGTCEVDADSGIFAPFEEDVIMDPVLDYINAMLMEEGMEDRTCMQHDCNTYQAIVNGFYEIIGDHSSSAVDCSVEDLTAPSYSSQPCLTDDDTNKLLVADDEYSWIDQFLPSTPLPASRTSVQPVADYGGSPADGDISFVKNEVLKLEADYANLYVGEWSPRSLAIDKGSGASANGKKSSAVRSRKGKGKGNNSNGDAALGSVDLRELLVSCAQAVARGDARKANEVVQELRRHGASVNGSGLQRVAHYFSEALMARMCGTGGHLYMAASNNTPSAAQMLKVFRLLFGVCPYSKLSHYFANQTILKAAEGACRLHIVDYGILYGTQWPCLINALADREGGPPLLVITGIELPQPGVNPAERLEDTGRRLAEYARTYNVPFEYHALAASKWEDVEKASLHLRQGEVLVVNSFKRLRHLLDESELASSPRQKVLNRMRSLNPNLVVIGVLSAAYNGAFFVPRFREALYQYSNFFDMMDTTFGECPERMTVESENAYRQILNIVACEGVERVERPETYKQWQARIQRAGFELLPIIPTVLSRSRSHVKNHFHKDFHVHDDSKQWMLLGWKGRTSIAISAWKPIPA